MLSRVHTLAREDCKQLLTHNSIVCARQGCNARAIMCGQRECQYLQDHIGHDQPLKISQFFAKVAVMARNKRAAERSEKLVTQLLHKLVRDAKELRDKHAQHLLRYPGNKLVYANSYQRLLKHEHMEDSEVTGDAFYNMRHETERIAELCNPYVFSARELQRKVEELEAKLGHFRSKLVLFWDPFAAFPSFNQTILTREHLRLWNSTTVESVTLSDCRSEQWLELGAMLASLPCLNNLIIKRCNCSDLMCQGLSRSGSLTTLCMGAITSDRRSLLVERCRDRKAHWAKASQAAQSQQKYLDAQKKILLQAANRLYAY